MTKPHTPDHMAAAVGQAVRNLECGGPGRGGDEFCNAAGLRREGKDCPCENTTKAVLAAIQEAARS